ncbi:hypothetical protein [Streptomyces sp. MI02-7b]|uniref:hypothetical protein n=1 Tax=Streptomyces sp. MI02-7b TaxID=462941 RepID=UPI0029BD2F35|nr:hypothetical protein [Streptomyces sp. MI02-7b]MDX3075913.1 hypothetical protein [Streptomyces sp. MI02-7b]
MRRTGHHPSVTALLLITDRPEGGGCTPLPGGLTVGQAHVVLAHEVEAGDLWIADFPDGESGVRESDHFEFPVTAQPRPYGSYCDRSCESCEDETGDATDAAVLYLILGRDEDGTCLDAFRNEPVLIIRAAEIP